MLTRFERMMLRINKMAEEGEGGGGTGGEGEGAWVDSLPEDVRGWDEAKNSDSPEKFWKQISDHRAFLGQSIRVPGEDASAEDRASFHKKLMEKAPDLMLRPGDNETEEMDSVYAMLGRPEEAEGYKIPEVDTKGVEVDNTPTESFKSLAHKYGLSQKQFEGIVSEMTTANVDAAIAQADQLKTTQAELKTEWGLAYDERMARVAKIAELTGAPEDLMGVIKSGGLNKGAATWLYNLSLKFKGEENNLLRDKSKEEGYLSPDEARIKISEIRNNKKHPYWHRNDPGNAAAKSLMSKLYRMATPEDK